MVANPSFYACPSPIFWETLIFQPVSAQELHQIGGHCTAVTTNPKADIFTVHLVAHVILETW
jgi:hypothetical protein